MNTFINYIINIPILMFSFCKKMPYTPMSILTPRHLVGPNHGKRDPTFQTVIKGVSLSAKGSRAEQYCKK